jgi:hypothetical protein
MSDDDSENRSLVSRVQSLPARIALVKRGIELTEILSEDAALAAFEMLGETFSGATTVELTLPELSERTMRNLTHNVPVVRVSWVFDGQGAPIEENQPILDTETDDGLHIEIFAGWCDGWPTAPEGAQVAGRVKAVHVKEGAMLGVGGRILTAEMTTNATVVNVISSANHARLVKEVRQRFAEIRAQKSRQASDVR